MTWKQPTELTSSQKEDEFQWNSEGESRPSNQTFARREFRFQQHPPNPRPNLTYPPLALSSATLHSRLKTKLCPIPILLLRHDTSATTTGHNHSPTLSPRLDLPGFWPGTETKREVWLLQTWFGIAPVNKLVSLTWLLWALRSFRRFTLHLH